MKITITADDFGLSDQIDEAICDLVSKGILNKVSVLTTVGSLREKVNTLRNLNPHIELAIHLNITDGRPLSPSGKISTLVRSTNDFYGGRHYLIAVLLQMGKISSNDVRTEWEMQISRMQELGVDISEINSHGHLHLHPALNHTICGLVEKSRIQKVRYIHSFCGFKAACYSILSKSLFKKVNPTAKMPRKLTLGIGREGSFDMNEFIRVVTKNEFDEVELITHPAVQGCPYQKKWGWKNPSDYSLLLSSQIKKILEKNEA